MAPCRTLYTPYESRTKRSIATFRVRHPNYQEIIAARGRVGDVMMRAQEGRQQVSGRMMMGQLAHGYVKARRNVAEWWQGLLL